MNEVPVWVQYATFGISIFMAIVAIAATLISYIVYIESTSPDVIVYLDQEANAKSVLNLVIKNIGKGAAKDIKFKPQRTLPKEAFGFDEAPMPKEMNSGPIVSGIPFLAPGAFRVIMLGQYGGLEKWLGNTSIYIDIEYKRANRPLFASSRINSQSSIDVFSFSGVDASDNSHGKAIKQELSKISKEISKISSSLKSDIQS